MDTTNPVDVERLSQHLGQASSQAQSPSTGGEIPTTEIITGNIEKVQEKAQGFLPPKEQLSPTGQAITQDLKKTAEDTESLLWKKNRDDFIQAIHAKVQSLVLLQKEDPAAERLRTHLQVTGESIWSTMDFGTMVNNLWILTKDLLTSNDMRQLLTESIKFAQSLFAYTTSEESVGETVSQEELVTQESRREEDAQQRNDDIKAKQEKLAQGWIDLLGRLKEKPEYQEVVANILGNLNIFWSISEEQSNKLDNDERVLLEKMQQMVRDIGWDLKELAERFTNTSIDDFLRTWQSLWQALQSSEETRELFNDTAIFTRRVLTDADYSDEATVEDARALTDRLSQLQEAYRPRIEHLLRLLRYYLDRISHDPHSRKLAGDLQQLTWHLFYDSQGNPTFKPELLMDLQRIVPSILRHLRYIKIPDIEIHEPGLDFIARNIVIDVGELIPHHLRLTLSSDIPEAGSSQTPLSSIDFEMERIHAEAHNIAFSINKSGIPSLMDSGLADVCIFGDGMQVSLRLEPIAAPIHHPELPKVPPSQLKAGLQVRQCLCKVDSFDLNIHGSGHDWMYYLLGPYVRRRVRQRIEESVVNYFMNVDLMTSIEIPEALSQALSSSASQQQQQQQQQHPSLSAATA